MTASRLPTLPRLELEGGRKKDQREIGVRDYGRRESNVKRPLKFSQIILN